MTDEVTIREAVEADHADVRSITADTWPDRPGGDYLGRVYPRWLDHGSRPKRTLVAEHEGQVVAIAQCVLLTEHEAWGQGLRVHPDHRGRGLSRRLTSELFDWARSRDAGVVRALVHGWNAAGLGQSRSTGYQPVGTFRWVHPEPGQTDRARTAVRDQPAIDVESISVRADPTSAWVGRHRSPGSAVLGGLGLSLEESWALVELTPSLLERAASQESVITVHDATGVAGMTYRSRVYEHEGDDGDQETVAEYGYASWSGLAAGAMLFDAIEGDAGEVGADRVRVAVPETAGVVSEAALYRADVTEYPEVVMEADLLGSAGNPARRRR